MTAKMSDRGDNLTEANLQAEGLREEPAQRAADRWEMEEEDSSPHNSPTWSPVQRPPTGQSQYELLFIDTSDFNR